MTLSSFFISNKYKQLVYKHLHSIFNSIKKYNSQEKIKFFSPAINEYFLSPEFGDKFPINDPILKDTMYSDRGNRRRFMNIYFENMHKRLIFAPQMND